MVEPKSDMLGDEQGAGLKIGGVDIEDLAFVAKRKYQQYLDKWQFYPGRRWGAFAVALCFFLLRMYI